MHRYHLTRGFTGSHAPESAAVCLKRGIIDSHAAASRGLPHDARPLQSA
jgi:hypothetical protein